MSDLYKEEYQTLRKEVETAMSELNALESSALLSSAAIFAWLATYASDGVVRFGWFIPSILVFFCMLRARSVNRHLGWLGQYLRTHESAHIQPMLSGWEHFLGDSEAGSNTPRRSYRGRVTNRLWGALFAATIAGAFFGYTGKPVALEVAKCTATR